MCFLGVELVMVAIAVEVARVPSLQTPKLPMFGSQIIPPAMRICKTP